MYFGFALDLSDIDLLNIDLVDQRYVHLDLLDTYIPNRHFFVFKTSSRLLQRNNFSSSKKSSWRPQDVFETSCEMSSRRLQDIFARRLQDVFKTSWRCLGKRKTVTLKTWCLEDVLKTNKCLLGLFLLRDKEEVICKNVLVL